MVPDFATPYLFTYEHHREDQNLNKRLRDLSLHSFAVDGKETGRVVHRALQQNHGLPGVILLCQGKLHGMISRRRFLERLSMPYGLELFLDRPLLDLYGFVKQSILVLPEDAAVMEAAKKALWRSPDLLDEPIVVEQSNGCYALLDMHQLLLVQSQIHQTTAELIAHLYKDLEKAHHMVQRLATIDELTQLANRRSFDKYLEVEWRRMAREKQPVSLIMIDIDCFKQYNDHYGHQQGDRCLQRVAEAIQHSICRPGDFAARYGGEEFILLLPNTPTSGGMHIAERIQHNIRNLAILHEHSQVAKHVTISLGLATLDPCPDSDPEKLIKLADDALYGAKRNGRDRLMVAQ